MSSREDKDLFLFGWFLIIVFAITMIALAIAVNNYSAQDDSKKPIALETNSIGCTKYRYKGDNYWKCPKGSGIKSNRRITCLWSWVRRRFMFWW